MHWVKATAPDGRPAYVNLDAIPSMLRNDELSITQLFLGGVTNVTSERGGTLFHANTQVRETPEALLALPKLEPAAMAIIHAARTATEAAHKAARAKQAEPVTVAEAPAPAVPAKKKSKTR